MLISELQETAAKRQAAEEAVRQSRTMFETLYEQSPDAIIVVDEIGKIDRVNAPAEALFGFSRERMLGQSIEILLPERLRNVHPAHRAGYMKEATTRPMGTGLQLSALRADGSEFPVDILLSPTNIDRRRLVLAVVRDVTERKRVEAQIQLLMRESNHRAKNILSLVQAIGRQTAAGSPEQFMERFTERIQALAANQDLLVSNKWQGVDLEDLLRAQLAHFADLIGARITGSGPKLRLNAATAQAIGLALHELATNAGKYGLSRRIGVASMSVGALTATHLPSAGPSATDHRCHRQSGVASAARSSFRWRRRPSAARSSSITLPRVWCGA
jgi:PAS domain S-box-containing protein